MSEFQTLIQSGGAMPESIARAQALDHAASMWVEGETFEDVLVRANAFHAFLTAHTRPGLTRSPTDASGMN